MTKAISVILYLVFYIGFYVLFADALRQEVQRLHARRIIKQKLKDEIKKENKRIGISEYLLQMLTVVKGKKTAEDLAKFYEQSIFLCVLFFLLSYTIMTPKVSIIAALMGLFLPFVYYRSLLQEIRTEASREGEVLATELLNNYKIYHYNMLEAVRNSAESISKEAPRSKRMLIELSYELNTASQADEIKRAVDRFKFGINTTWATLLATNIGLAQIEGMNVTDAMEDLIQSIIKARKTAEETKRQGAEGRRMLKVLVPGIYLITIIGATTVFNMSLSEFFYNQFRTESGSMWFLAVAITYAVSIIASVAISKDKMDI